MMKMPSSRALRGRWRSWLFRAWIGASFLVSIFVAVAGPFASYFDEGRSVVAIAVPAVMVFMLATGLGWLVMLVTSGRRDRRA